MSAMDDGVLVRHDSALVRTLSRRELIANLIHLCVLLAVVAPTGLFEPDAYMRSLAVLVCACYIAALIHLWQLRLMAKQYGPGVPPVPPLIAVMLIYGVCVALPIGGIAYGAVSALFENEGTPPSFHLPFWGALIAVLAPPGDVLYRIWGIKAAQRHHAAVTNGAETREQVAVLERIANQDALTGLPNRRCFENELAQLGASGQEFAVMFVDFDKFKPINDQYGHAVGDEFLKAIAKRIKSLVRESDLVARLGGDEFAVLIRGGDARSASTQLADRFTQAMKQPVVCAEVELFSSASVGIAIGTAGRDDLEQVVHLADLAMYEAKKGGGAGYRVAA